MAETQLSLVGAGGQIEQHTVTYEGDDVDTAISDLITDRRQSTRRPDRPFDPTHIVFFWEDEWHLIDRGGRRRYYDTREAAEMVAIHNG